MAHSLAGALQRSTSTSTAPRSSRTQCSGLGAAPVVGLGRGAYRSSGRNPLQGCRVAELDAQQLDALWKEERQLLASHLSFEGEFVPEELWAVYARASASTGSTSHVAHHDSPAGVDHPLLQEHAYLEALLKKLSKAGSSTAEKALVLMETERVHAFMQLHGPHVVQRALLDMQVDQQYLLLSLIAMGQEHVLLQPAQGAQLSGEELRAQLTALASSLARVEQFYDSIGGLVGYQAKSLELIISGTAELREARERRKQEQAQRAQHGRRAGHASGASSFHVPAEVLPHMDHAPSESVADVQYHVPRAVDLAGEGGREVGQGVAAAGLMAMPRMAEIYPVGGAGDRLGLKCEVTGECLPAAMLPYCGRTMMEGLIRDLQAREYLYYQLTGRQVTVPVAIMTSDAKGNHQRMMALMERLAWLGRGKDAYRLFRQPLVPVLSVGDGKWLLDGPMQPMTKPGGHGVIWKLMRDEGVFAWLGQQGREAALVRQISNPMAGVDTTLLALAGAGQQQRGAFGFMSCDRTIGAAEGCNVLQERRIVGADGKVSYEYGYTNIEYTEFERLGISDQAVDGTSRRSVFPANTNVLYVGLQAAQGVVEGAVSTGSSEKLMPGLIFNLKKKVSYRDPLAAPGAPEQKLHAGRMECTMQNIADFMTDRFPGALSPNEAAHRELSTFLVYNMRRKVTSSAKKRRDPAAGTRISQTPDGSFFDLQRNAWQLLQQCGMNVAELGAVEQYLESGPGFIFLFHPALGPLWDVISQKISGGSLAERSEMVLEVAEARLRNVHVQGSFLVHAENVMGHMEHASGGSGDNLLSYSTRCGRINMSNVQVRNKGINWAAPGNVYWKHQVARHEEVRVVLRGQSEFEAHDVVITGAHTFEVPDGHRMVVTQAPQGGVRVSCEPLQGQKPSWVWRYSMDKAGRVSLEYAALAARQQQQVQHQLQHAQYAMPHGAVANSIQPVAGFRHKDLLQQLIEVDSVLDFVI